MPRSVVNRWIAYYELEPFGDQWRAAGEQAAATHNLGCTIAASRGIEIPMRTAESYLPVPPDDDETPTAAGRRLTADECRFAFQIGFGF